MIKKVRNYSCNKL